MFCLAIDPTEFDLLGGVRLPIAPESDWRSLSRRVSRVATLDGGADVSDTGYAAADRTVTAVVPGVDGDTYDRSAEIVRTHATVWLSTDEACLLAIPERIRLADGDMTLTLLVWLDLTG